MTTCTALTVGARVIHRDDRCVVTSLRSGGAGLDPGRGGYLRVIEPGPDSPRALGAEVFVWAWECEPDEEGDA